MCLPCETPAELVGTGKLGRGTPGGGTRGRSGGEGSAPGGACCRLAYHLVFSYLARGLLSTNLRWLTGITSPEIGATVSHGSFLTPFAPCLPSFRAAPGGAPGPGRGRAYALHHRPRVCRIPRAYVPGYTLALALEVLVP